jgi:hypothetical protein
MARVHRDLPSLFEAGILVRPTDEKPNLVHLACAVALCAGVADVQRSPCVEMLAEEIGAARHLVFVLLDGLGMNLVRRMEPSSFIVRNLKRELNSTCPSTTACALTSVATGEYASRHGVTGWHTYLPDFGISITTLPFVERITSQPLASRGIRPEDVLPVGALMPRMTLEPMTLVPALLANTSYNLFTRGGTAGFGYTSVQQAMNQIVQRIRHATRPTYTHLYMPEVDTMCHRFGAEHPELMALVANIDAELDRLATALAGEARIVVSADHGLIDVPHEQQTLLMSGDPLLELLVVPPTGDARMPIFHVRDGQGPAFAEAFHARFADRFILASIAEAQRLELFGPGELSPVARRRFGDFVGFPYRPAALSFHPLNKPPSHIYKAIHAGLSPEEMRVPLCLA